jgi:hypothetical protein
VTVAMAAHLDEPHTGFAIRRLSEHAALHRKQTTGIWRG